jgi:translocator protein
MATTAHPVHHRSDQRHDHRRVGRATVVGMLVVSIALVVAVALIGEQWTETGAGTWYDGLTKPAWNPPGAVFGPVWGVLYLAMAVAAWLVAREWGAHDRVPGALALYGVQLAANLAWTGLFFGLESPGWALVDIVALAVLIVATILAFRRVSRPAAWLLVPYLAWVLFATSITAAVVVEN